jgi:hypothetical protein
MVAYTRSCETHVEAIHQVYNHVDDISGLIVRREANQNADSLAKYGLMLEISVKIFKFYLYFISNVFVGCCY